MPDIPFRPRPLALLLGDELCPRTQRLSNRFRVDIPRYVDFYLAGRLHLDVMITERVRLEELNEAFAAMKTGEVARSVIMVD